MNQKHLKKIFENYINKFETFNTPDGINESFKWSIVKDFRNALDLDIDNNKFADMLYQTWKTTSSLIDSNQQQPFYGMCEYAKKEPETVRAMFENLFADDDDDLKKRQMKINRFVEQASELHDKYTPISRLYVNNQRSAMAYLWFYDPDKYYYYKASEAKALADCVEFYDDWGTYDNFDLEIYHRFCDEIIEYMKQDTALMETHCSRFEGREDEMHPDEMLHILLVDIIFCAGRYGLFDGIKIKDASAAAKRLYQERKNEAVIRYEKFKVAEENTKLLAEAKECIPQMLSVGSEVTHKAFGKGNIVEISGDNITVYFQDKDITKTFVTFTVISGGFLKCTHSDFNQLVAKYKYVMAREKLVVTEHNLAIKNMQAYWDYIDFD